MDAFRIFSRGDVFQQASLRLLAHGQQTRGLWIHDGHKKRPHLCSGSLHSDVFFSAPLLFQEAGVLDDIAVALVGLLAKGVQANTGVINRVLSFAEYQAFAFAIARIIQQTRNAPCFWSQLVSATYRSKYSYFFDGPRIVPGEHVTLFLSLFEAETGEKNIHDLAEMVSDAGAVVSPYVLTVINFSGQLVVKGRQIISLFQHEVGTWPASECPLCKAGSEVIGPVEDPAVWSRLTASLPKEKSVSEDKKK